LQLVNLAEYEAAARGKIPEMFYDYIAGGANDEITLRENHAAYDQIRLRPRVLVDVEHIDLSMSILGIPVKMPVLISPTASHKLAHPDGEIATARAAHAADTIFTVSTFANDSIEAIAAATDGPLWFQLYTYRDSGINHLLIEQAVAGGARALVVTVDTPYLGRRERDIRNNFMRPPHVQDAHLKMAAIDESADQSGRGAANIFHGYDLRSTSLTWRDLATFREWAKMPLILKGIVTAEDARIALDHGVDAIIVSNHGGRQLDTCIPTIEALPEVVEAVAGRIPVLVDGGIRRGTDVVKAIALGASATLIGRPIVWGLAVDGEAGARHVLELLRAEIELAMALCGKTTISAIDRSLVRRGHPID
jgi:4-hydroxymandelate oxidase